MKTKYRLVLANNDEMALVFGRDLSSVKFENDKYIYLPLDNLLF